MLDKAKVRELRIKLQAHLDSFGDDEYQVQVGGASFSDNNVRFKVDVNAVGEDGNAVSREAEDFRLYADRWGLRPEDLGREFTRDRDNETFKIVGGKPRSRKYPIIARNVRTGKEYKFDVSAIKRYLAPVASPACES